MGLAERAAPAAVLLLLAAVSVGRRQAVEEVTKKQLEAYVAEEDYLAVYWCKFHLQGYPSGCFLGLVDIKTKI